MNQDIKSLLSELYQLDPSLKNRETELINLLTEIVKSQPKVVIDQDFKNRLEKMLYEKEQNKKLISQDPVSKLFSLKKIGFGTAGLVVIIVAVAISINLRDGNSTLLNKTNSVVANLQERAFGELPAFDSSDSNKQSLQTAEGTTNNSDTDMAEPSILPEPYYSKNYRYVYQKDLPDWDSSLNVLKKQNNSSVVAQTPDLLGSFGLGLVDINSFANANIRSIVLAQDNDNGYNVNVDLYSGIVSISSNMYDYSIYSSRSISSSYMMPESNNYNPLTKEDVLPDSELFKIADDFIDEHNINLENYDNPQVAYPYQYDYDEYIPESIQIVYPQIVNGLHVYQSSGEPAGVYADISLRSKKVTGVTNLSTRQYQSAPYETVSDKNAVRELISQGGLYGYSDPGASETIDINLADPVIGYSIISKMDGDEYSEFLVPVLVFKVLNPNNSQEIGWKQNVIVPLIEDFFEGDNSIYPLMEKQEDGSAVDM